MTEPRDYVELGTARWPDGSKTPNMLTYFTVYMQVLVNNETALLQLLDALADWKVSQVRTFDFVLNTIGKLIGQPRPSGFSNDDYRRVLIGRTIARVSNATKPDIVRLISYLSSINGGTSSFSVFGGVPEHWQISIFNVVLTPQWEALYVRLIFDTIAATDSFDLSIGAGAAATYDDEKSLYDASVYSP